MLNEKQLETYSRQMILPEVGLEGQEKLLSSTVLICGVGGLGSPVALYLAAMGIGRIGLVDGDTVSLSNLNRQLLYTPADVGRLKAKVAAERLGEQNPDISIVPYAEMLTKDNAPGLFDGYDIIVDCLDNFAARFILNDVCLNQNKPFVHAGVSHLSGQVMTVIPSKSPCLRCLLPEGDKEYKDEDIKGIIGATAGVVGAFQATEVYKYLLGLSVCDHGLLLYDGLRGSMRYLTIDPDPDCLCQK